VGNFSAKGKEPVGSLLHEINKFVVAGECERGEEEGASSARGKEEATGGSTNEFVEAMREMRGMLRCAKRALYHS